MGMQRNTHYRTGEPSDRQDVKSLSYQPSPFSTLVYLPISIITPERQAKKCYQGT